MTINEILDRTSELTEFIFAARDCLDDLDYKPDVRLGEAIKVLNNCSGPTLVKYGAILRQMHEIRADSTMMRIYGLYSQTFQERITSF